MNRIASISYVYFACQPEDKGLSQKHAVIMEARSDFLIKTPWWKATVIAADCVNLCQTEQRHSFAYVDILWQSTLTRVPRWFCGFAASLTFVWFHIRYLERLNEPTANVRPAVSWDRDINFISLAFRDLCFMTADVIWQAIHESVNVYRICTI